MIKRSFFKSKYLPYLLILPQMVVTLTFFYWPAIQGIIQSFLLSDPFGRKSTFVWFYNYRELFTDPLYLKSIFITCTFSIAVAAVSLSLVLFIASMANRALKAT
ncbi:MAG: glycerol-3-phosphate transporter permease, partial [Desulfobacterales bacterium]|nr:glycerol-3-phosphate transporter permease [Desulfobacterales bacterium]